MQAALLADLLSVSRSTSTLTEACLADPDGTGEAGALGLVLAVPSGMAWPWVSLGLSHTLPLIEARICVVPSVFCIFAVYAC